MRKIKGINWYTTKEVFSKSLQSKKFKAGYKAEATRLLLANQIKELRATKKMTQKQVASKARMPQSVVARLESGSHSVSVATLARIASVFGKGIQLA